MREKNLYPTRPFPRLGAFISLLQTHPNEHYWGGPGLGRSARTPDEPNSNSDCPGSSSNLDPDSTKTALRLGPRVGTDHKLGLDLCEPQNPNLGLCEPEPEPEPDCRHRRVAATTSGCWHQGTHALLVFGVEDLRRQPVNLAHTSQSRARPASLHPLLRAQAPLLGPPDGRGVLRARLRPAPGSWSAARRGRSNASSAGGSTRQGGARARSHAAPPGLHARGTRRPMAEKSVEELRDPVSLSPRPRRPTRGRPAGTRWCCS